LITAEAEPVANRALVVGLLYLLGAIAPLGGADPKPRFRLTLRVQELTAALVNNRSWEMYQLFVPAFRAAVSYQRFDSAFRSWVGGRRVTRASFRVIDVRGLGGHASTYVRFEDEFDYHYVFQSWLNTGTDWQLVWLSNILDQSFDYGRSDTADLRAVAQTALHYLLSPEGLTRLNKGLVVPETVVVVQHGRTEEAVFALDGHTIVWLTPDVIAANRNLPTGQFHCEFGLVRIFGDLALAAVDIVPREQSRPGPLGRRRGMEIYLSRSKTSGHSWQFHSVGKVY